jgi:hypothetical protein
MGSARRPAHLLFLDEAFGQQLTNRRLGVISVKSIEIFPGKTVAGSRSAARVATSSKKKR